LPAPIMFRFFLLFFFVGGGKQRKDQLSPGWRLREAIKLKDIRSSLKNFMANSPAEFQMRVFGCVCVHHIVNIVHNFNFFFV
jgi:hypothetical protein